MTDADDGLVERIKEAQAKVMDLEAEERRLKGQIKLVRADLTEWRGEVKDLLGELTRPRPMPLFEGGGIPAEPPSIPDGQPAGTVGHPHGARFPSDAAAGHKHTRDCYDDAGPGAGGVSLICDTPEGEPEQVSQTVIDLADLCQFHEPPPPPDPAIDPLSVACPHCGAKAGSPCINEGKFKGTHAPRHERARREARKAARRADLGAKQQAKEARATERGKQALRRQLASEGRAEQAALESTPADGEGFVAAHERVNEQIREQGGANRTRTVKPKAKVRG